MSSDSLFWISLGALLIAHLSSIGSRILHELSWHELGEYCRRRKKKHLFDAIHDRHDDVAFSVESLRVVSASLFVLSAGYYLRVSSAADSTTLWNGFLSNFVLITTALLVTGVWTPWAIAQFWDIPFLAHTWRVWTTTDHVLFPLRLGSKFFQTLLKRLAGDVRQPNEEEAFEEEIRTIVTEGLHDGLLEADAREMIEGVIELGDVDVADIMTPRSEMDVLSINLDLPELSRQVIQNGRTRVPIYDGKLDNIIGILYVKDLLREIAKEDSTRRMPLRKLLRDPWFVPKSKRVNELLQAFLKTRNHLAIVVDEYRRVSGLVTIEDALEEIVGEIVDESDKEELNEIQTIAENEALIHGRAHLDEINEQLGTEFPEEEEFDTIGGFVIKQLGRIPRVGELLNWNDLSIKVEEATPRRVERVRLQILQSATRH